MKRVVTAASLNIALQAFAAGLRPHGPSRTAGYLAGLMGARFDIRVLQPDYAIDGLSYASGFSEGRRARLKTKRDADVAA